MSDNNGWQPIETAPKDGTRVDLWVVWPAYGSEPEKASRRPNSKWLDGDWEIGQFSLHMYSAKPYATHWMPVPEGPSR